MNGWYIGTGIVAIVLFIGIATRGLSYIHKYRSPAPLIGGVLFWAAMALLTLGFAGAVWNGILVYQLFIEQGPLAQDDRIIWYTVIGHIAYITACLLWFILMIYMVARYRSQMKAVLSSSFIERPEQ